MKITKRICFQFIVVAVWCYNRLVCRIVTCNAIPKIKLAGLGTFAQSPQLSLVFLLRVFGTRLFLLWLLLFGLLILALLLLSF